MTSKINPRLPHCPIIWYNSSNYSNWNRLEQIVLQRTPIGAVGNTASTSVGSQELASYTYNSYNGKIKKIEYGNGFSVRYVYDKLDNLTEVWYTNGGSETKAYVYTYTDSGQVACLDNLLTDKSTIYTYDASGKLIGYAECDSDSNTITHGVRLSYDDFSQVSNQTHWIDYVTGSASKHYAYNYHYMYNEDGTLRTAEMQFNLGAGSNSYTGTFDYTYDAYNRLKKTEMSIPNKFNQTVEYDFTANGSNTSTQISTYSSKVNSNAKKTYTFTYDDNGNITSIKVNGTEQNRYKYDDIGQLTREDNVASGRTYLYTYDNAGNILTKKIYSIAAEGSEPTSLISTLTYTYGNTNWGDQLTKYNGNTITYDAIGNPLTYYNGLSYTFSWKNGRQLATVSGAANLSFEYNEEGIRTSKTANGVEHIYHLNGSTIVAEEWGNKLLIYLYDANGSPIGMQYRTTSYAEGVFDTYWFEKNLQGDIVAVYNDAGTLLVTYTYDAWGYLLSTQYYNSGSGTAVQYNPFRYRGYYRDSETGFYYLNSRYYDPAIGRWINADDNEVISIEAKSVLHYNLYSYCWNNPINMTDDNGYLPWFVGAAVGGALFDTALYLFNSARSGQEITWEGVGKAALEGAISGIVFGAIGKGVKAITSAVKATKTASKFADAGIKIMNKKYANKVFELTGELAKKYGKGIKFNKYGFPDFSKFAKYQTKIKGLTGNYAKDAAMANKVFKLNVTPKGYTWHHVEDGVTMMLIPTDLHQAVRHTGGAAIIKALFRG